MHLYRMRELNSDYVDTICQKIVIEKYIVFM